MANTTRKRLDGNSYRLVPARYPPVAVFENLLDPGELEAAYRLESLTNDRLRDEAGDIAMVPPADRVVGPGSTPIMAAFTHIGMASRFTDGSYGVYYAGLELPTAILEARHSRERFLRATREPPQTLTMRCYVCRIRAELVDVRDNPRIHRPEDHQPARELGRRLREGGENGVLYRSLRHPGGECVAVFRPPALRPPARQAGHFEFHWNGERIEHVLRLRRIM